MRKEDVGIVTELNIQINVYKLAFCNPILGSIDTADVCEFVYFGLFDYDFLAGCTGL